MSHVITFKCVPDQTHGEFSANLISFPHEIKPSTIRFRMACDHLPVNGFPCDRVHDLFFEPHKDLAEMRSNLRPAYLSFLYWMLTSLDHEAVDYVPAPELANIPEAYQFMKQAYERYCKSYTENSRKRLAYIRSVALKDRDPAIMQGFRAESERLVRAHRTAALQYVTWYLCFDSTQPGNYL